VAWSAPASAQAADGAFAEAALVFGGAGTLSEYLFAIDFNFAIPSGEIVNGIEARVLAKASSANAEVDGVRLIIGGSPAGEIKGADTPVPQTLQALTFGGGSDRWAVDLPRATVQSADFGLAFRVRLAVPFGGATVSVDHVELTVHTSAGVFRSVAGQMFVPGSTAGEVFRPGAVKAQLFAPGAVAGDLFTPGAAKGAVFVPGSQAGQIR
jgi:hypothetical protein